MPKNGAVSSLADPRKICMSSGRFSAWLSPLERRCHGGINMCSNRESRAAFSECGNLIDWCGELGRPEALPTLEKPTNLARAYAGSVYPVRLSKYHFTSWLRLTNYINDIVINFSLRMPAISGSRPPYSPTKFRFTIGFRGTFTELLTVRDSISLSLVAVLRSASSALRLSPRAFTSAMVALLLSHTSSCRFTEGTSFIQSEVLYNHVGTYPPSQDSVLLVPAKPRSMRSF